MILILRLALSCALLFFAGSSWADWRCDTAGGTVTSSAPSISASGTNCRWGGPNLQVDAGVIISSTGGTVVPFGAGNRPSISPGVLTNLGTITFGAGSAINTNTITVRNTSTTLANPINNLSVVSGGSVFSEGNAAIGIASGTVLTGASSSYANYTGTYYAGSISSAIYNQAGAFIGQNSAGGYLSDSGIANAGTISGGTIANSGAIFNAGTIRGYSSAILNNSGGVINNSTAGNFFSAIANMDTGVLNGGITNSGDIGTNLYTSSTYAITNYGSITAPTTANYNSGWAIYNTGNIGSSSSPGVTNGIQNNTPTGIIAGIYNASGAYIGSIANSGGVISNSITNDGGRINGISNSFTTDFGVIDSIINKSGGVITGQDSSSYGYAINNFQGKITTGITNESSANIVGGISVTGYGSEVASISNAGTICSVTGANTCTGTTTGAAINVGSNGLASTNPTIQTITNTGSIIGAVGIQNAGSITTLKNAQGAGNSNGALTYSGVLPTNYSIIINNTGSFGKLSVTGGTGSTAFGINTGSIVSNNHTYVGVLSGVTAGQVTNTSGTYGSYSWALSLESGSSTIWDLIFGSLIPPGPSTADTQTSLANTASALQNTFTLQNSVLANSFTYDCELFDVNNICVSAGGRNTAVSASNGLNNTSALLIAAYRPHPNYRIGAYADQNLSVNNAGSTVNLGNNTPLIGVFGAWNERLDGTGTEVKVTAAYGQKNTTVTRGVVGSGTTASEAGSGSSQLNSQGAQVIAKYGFGLADSIVLSPYVGVRYTQNNMSGYTEATSTSVTAPLTYSAVNTNATTALAGVGASYKFIPQAMVFASAGVETDTNTANGTYSATGVTGLTPINFNANPVKTRPTATVGAYYDIVKNQRLGVTGIYRQEPYQAVSTTTVMATYTIGL